MRLQERDVLIVDAVHRHRVLSTDQIAKLFFPTASGAVSSSCLARLRGLVKLGYLHRGEQEQVRRDGRKPYVYMLTRAGSQLLQGELGLEPEDIDWKPSHLSVRSFFLQHQLAINDVYVSMALATMRIGWHLSQWVDDRFLRKQHVKRVFVPERGKEVAVVPDAFLSLTGPDGTPRMHFFLEVDRATETVVGMSHRVKSWQDKVRAYQAYFASDQIVERYGTRRIRVLTVTTGPERARHLKKATEEVGGRYRYWFTWADQVAVEKCLTRAIWQKASSEDAHAIIETL